MGAYKTSGRVWTSSRSGRKRQLSESSMGGNGSRHEPFMRIRLASRVQYARHHESCKRSGAAPGSTANQWARLASNYASLDFSSERNTASTSGNTRRRAAQTLTVVSESVRKLQKIRQMSALEGETKRNCSRKKVKGAVLKCWTDEPPKKRRILKPAKDAA